MSIMKELRYFAKDLSILVVEDDVQLNEELVELVSVFFNEIDFAYNGVEALEKYKNKKYDLILSDITMPKMDGVKLSQELININKFQSIIILSAHTEINYLVDLIDIGIKQFVAKPFEHQELLYRLLKVCENKTHDKQLKKFINNSKLPVEQRIEKTIKNAKNNKDISVEKTVKEDKNFEDINVENKVQHEQLAANKFMESLKIDTLAWISIEPQIEDLIEVDEDFSELIDKIYLNDISSQITQSIAVLLKKMYAIFSYIDELSNISEVLMDLAVYLEEIDVESLSDEKKQKLKILEFIHDDISRFVQTVFIYQDTLDIHYLEDSLRSSVEQLKISMLDEDMEEEELELF